MAVIAIDIGGTKMKAGLVSNDYSLLSSFQIPSLPKKGKSHFLSNLKSLISSLISGSKHKITAIGISIPGYVNDSGKLVDVGNTLSFLSGFPLKSYLEKVFSLPVIIENDANCFVLAESNIGESKVYSKVIGVIWGSGIGAGFSIDGSLQPFPMEFGHNKVLFENKFVDLELVSGGVYMEKNYHKISKNKLSVSQIYSSKDPIAKKIMSDSIEYLGREISSLVNIFNPDVVVLGGGVSQLPLTVYKKLLTQIKKNSLPAHLKKFKLLRYSISDDAGVLGAGIIALKK